MASAEIAAPIHPAATGHIPAFIPMPGETDALLVVTAVFLLLVVMAIGSLYFRLHALPEHMAHGANKVQFQIVAVLALIALVTHNHLFWIAALILALVHIPDFSTPIASITGSLEKIANRGDGRKGVGGDRPDETDTQRASGS